MSTGYETINLLNILLSIELFSVGTMLSVVQCMFCSVCFEHLMSFFSPHIPTSGQHLLCDPHLQIKHYLYDTLLEGRCVLYTCVSKSVKSPTGTIAA